MFPARHGGISLQVNTQEVKEGLSWVLDQPGLLYRKLHTSLGYTVKPYLQNFNGNMGRGREAFYKLGNFLQVYLGLEPPRSRPERSMLTQRVLGDSFGKTPKRMRKGDREASKEQGSQASHAYSPPPGGCGEYNSGQPCSGSGNRLGSSR